MSGFSPSAKTSRRRRQHQRQHQHNNYQHQFQQQQQPHVTTNQARKASNQIPQANQFNHRSLSVSSSLVSSSLSSSASSSNNFPTSLNHAFAATSSSSCSSSCSSASSDGCDSPRYEPAGFWFPPDAASQLTQQLPPPRPWIKAQQQVQASSSGPEFSVLSYNVLCDRMVTPQMFPDSPQLALNWLYRRDLIMKQLLEMNADIVALQELEQEQFETFFRPKLLLFGQYESMFEPKSRAKTMEFFRRGRVDGCAIFYKKNKFKLVERHLLEFNQIAMANARGSEAMLNRVMTKDNIGLAAVLEFIEPLAAPSSREQQHSRLRSSCNVADQRILVCNTHIHWDPECCDVKLIQTIMLMNELECIAKNHKLSSLGPSKQQMKARDLNELSANKNSIVSDNILVDSHTNLPTDSEINDLMPLVLLGDFNSLPSSGVASYLLAGQINSLHKDFKNFKYTACSNALSSFLPSPVGPSNAAAQQRRQSTPAWCYYNNNSSTSSSLNRTPVTTNELFDYKHHFKLTSAYSRDMMPFTNYTTNFKAIIDYIFYSSNQIQLLSLLGPLDTNWMKGNGIQGLPQPNLPSDHLPLMARLRLNNKRAQAAPANHQVLTSSARFNKPHSRRQFHKSNYAKNLTGSVEPGHSKSIELILNRTTSNRS